MSRSSIKTVVVVRHGERLDYVTRDSGGNWIPTTDQPWNPPLTENGHQQAKGLGVALPEILSSLNLPPVAAVYSSPFHRCRQTAAGLIGSNQNLKIRAELGLSESINENWFRSWAVEGTDGTWGYQRKDCPNVDPETLHSGSKEPVQPLLDWKTGPIDAVTSSMMDANYISKSSIDTPFSLHPPNFESSKMQQNRMAETLNTLSENHVNESFVMVSHGGPVTHLYESLTGNKWNVHGVAKYCCYSIYQQKEGEQAWTPIVVNRIQWEDSKEKDETSKFVWN
mmetsp:Transcript_7447/g.10841  ORF Transcript_7447/g.10841 Transcript_7447/m.10841 type:complete len:281 (-) Transcript_7447:137-979(-)